MGCDIHFYVERYTSEPDNSNGPRDISKQRQDRIESIIKGSIIEPRWISADTWTLNKYPGEPDYWENYELYSGRNYYLFYFLAGVRSGPIPPLDDPRGVPDDASYAYRSIVDRWKGDGHSHSYFTLSELLDVPDDTWDKLECPEFRETLRQMQEIDPSPDNVRACFFFDN